MRAKEWALCVVVDSPSWTANLHDVPNTKLDVLYYNLPAGCCCIVIVFFFSSRRRHTRCSRDWSSDVCSSDLTDQWPWEFKSANKPSDTLPPRNPLPFDCVLFVNSAAPSIYTKQLSDLLWAHKDRKSVV